MNFLIGMWSMPGRITAGTYAVQKRIKELGVESDFTYLGDLNDLEKWSAYRRADIFVLPTYSENFGIVVAEALAAGVPVITTRGALVGTGRHLRRHSRGK